MSGPGEGKIKIGKADVYIHVKGKSNARITHVDIELEELNEGALKIQEHISKTMSEILHNGRLFLW